MRVSRRRSVSDGGVAGAGPDVRGGSCPYGRPAERLPDCPADLLTASNPATYLSADAQLYLVGGNSHDPRYLRGTPTGPTIKQTTKSCMTTETTPHTPPTFDDLTTFFQAHLQNH
ncbi:hypothetical protein GFY24_34185 [Nocardia sp. SYP-A9097]|uniref:hypothetical protein n=1 Tax=Nocardia sp. SYP-A9097 TaxID=2663237 RepID=UPI00129A608D|nr:hypothetical protein [Nocardia sp. SYP-A9097]MRH92417.1 hypothetical protein [Nocardia sp. SYP-A9097]